MIKRYYTYTYTDPRTSTCFYVGKGVGRRYLNHWEKGSHNEWVNQILDDLRKHNTKPTIKRYFCDDEQMAYDLEVLLISKYGRIDLGTGTLCNKTAGGDDDTKRDTKKISEDKYKFVSQEQVDKIQRRALFLKEKNLWSDFEKQRYIQQMMDKYARKAYKEIARDLRIIRKYK